MVDDLITLGTREPYRMFTSRAEYRLMLREDNADLRLTEIGRELNLVDDARWESFSTKREAIAQEQQRLATTFVHPDTAEAAQLAEKIGQNVTREYSLLDLIKRPELTYADVAALKGEATNDPAVAEQVEIQIKYAGYIDRQADDIDRLKRYENIALPIDLDYTMVQSLSNEVRAKLIEARPETLGRASRVPGVTAAAVSLLLIYLKKRGLLDRKTA
jgi:tRNA uridine 5-carboxymethylaminomethyl modification enzyme